MVEAKTGLSSGTSNSAGEGKGETGELELDQKRLGVALPWGALEPPQRACGDASPCGRVSPRWHLTAGADLGPHLGGLLIGARVLEGLALLHVGLCCGEVAGRKAASGAAELGRARQGDSLLSRGYSGPRSMSTACSATCRLQPWRGVRGHPPAQSLESVLSGCGQSLNALPSPTHDSQAGRSSLAQMVCGQGRWMRGAGDAQAQAIRLGRLADGMPAPLRSP